MAFGATWMSVASLVGLLVICIIQIIVKQNDGDSWIAEGVIGILTILLIVGIGYVWYRQRTQSIPALKWILLGVDVIWTLLAGAGAFLWLSHAMEDGHIRTTPLVTGTAATLIAFLGMTRLLFGHLAWSSISRLYATKTPILLEEAKDSGQFSRSVVIHTDVDASGQDLHRARAPIRHTPPTMYRPMTHGPRTKLPPMYRASHT